MTMHRPELHIAPENGIIEAPAGVLYDGTAWHVFYQRRTEPNSPSRWGHMYSEDLPFDWLECDDALAPAGGEIGLRAGSVIAVDGNVNLYFTSVTSTGTTIRLAQIEHFDDTCDVSDDVDSVDHRVLRKGQLVGDSPEFKRFRSPLVIPDWVDSQQRGDGYEGWLMLAVAGDAEHPQLIVLRSPDGISWEVSGKLEFEGDLGTEVTASDVVVSPRIVRLKDEVDEKIYDVLLVTVETNGKEYAGYVVGQLHGTTFSVDVPFQRLDYGHDFTRPRSTTYTPSVIDPDTRYDQALLFGWLNGTGRRDDVSNHRSWRDAGWANALSLPRVLTLQGGKIFQTPTPGLPDVVADSKRARMWTGRLEVPAGSSVTVNLLDSSGQPAATVTHKGDELILDRSFSASQGDAKLPTSPDSPQDRPAVAHLDEGDSDSLTIIVDGSTVEVFADSGQVAMASRVYFEGGCSGITTNVEGDADILNEWHVHHDD
ncbi:MAG: GH32 C-terminal domain-containing protein [Corynebacterium sp.]|nr:GH32 C-terminal domain-containing protein [Corynebacterium sp.]